MIHCLNSGDDEAVCSTKDCPKGCQCRGLTIFCAEVVLHWVDKAKFISYDRAIFLHMTVVPLDWLEKIHNSLILDISHSPDTFPGYLHNGLFVKMSSLVILKLINTGINTLRNKPFVHLRKILEVSLQLNSIPDIEARSFFGLATLQILDLQRISARNLHSNCFLGLTSLQTLNLNDNKFTALGRNVFSGLSRLKLLYIRNNSLTYLHNDLFSFPGSVTLFTDTNLICCFISKSATCNASIAYAQVICTQVLTSLLSNAFGVSVAIYCFTISAAILYKKLRKRQYNSLFPVIIFAPIIDIISAYLLIQICATDINYNKTYPWVRLALLQHFLCTVQSILTIFIQFTSSLIVATSTVIYYRVTIQALVKKPFTMSQVVACLLLLMMLILASSVSYTLTIKNYNILFCFPFGVDFIFQTKTIDICIQTFVIFFNSTILIFVILTDKRIIQSLRKKEKYLLQNTINKKPSRSSVVQRNLMRSVMVQVLALLFQYIYVTLPMISDSVSNDVYYILLSAFVGCNCTNNIMHHGTVVVVDTYKELNETMSRHFRITFLFAYKFLRRVCKIMWNVL